MCSVECAYAPVDFCLFDSILVIPSRRFFYFCTLSFRGMIELCDFCSKPLRINLISTVMKFEPEIVSMYVQILL